MPSDDVQTFHEHGWHNRIVGSPEDTTSIWDPPRVLSSHYDRDSAIRAGREAAQERQVGHIIKNMDGTVAETNSYRHDPPEVLDGG